MSFYCLIKYFCQISVQLGHRNMYIPKVPHYWHLQHEGTGVSTNLRSQWVFIALVNINAKFQLIKTTGTWNTRKYHLALPVSKTDQRMVQIKKFLVKDRDFSVPNNCVCLLGLQRELCIKLTSDRRTNGGTLGGQ